MIGQPYEPGETEAPSWARPFLAMGSSVFGAAVRIRGAAYRTGILRPERAGRAVISVGNLMAGGVGKTPFVVLLAQRLGARGVFAAVLSRGHGGRLEAEGRAAVVARGGGQAPILGADEAGDEPVMIAHKTKAAVVVAKDRVRAAALAVGELGAEVLILDDGFQHLPLVRDLDIVVLDGARPLGSGRLLPLGPLREPKEALKRAGLLVFNHGVKRRGDPQAAIGRGFEHVPAVEVVVRPTAVGALPPRSIEGAKVALLAAIGRPRRFEETVASLGAQIVHCAFYRDHAHVEPPAIEAFAADAKARGATRLLTTEKDQVRLRSDLLEALIIEHALVAGEEALDRAVAAVLTPGD